VHVDTPAEEATEDDVRLTVIQPRPKPTPVGVGAEGGGEDEAPPESPDEPASSE
jgi:hypothetical protein